MRFFIVSPEPIVPEVPRARTVVLRSPFIGAYCEPGVTLALVPFAVDQPRSLALASDALRTHLAPGENFADLWPPIDSANRYVPRDRGLGPVGGGGGPRDRGLGARPDRSVSRFVSSIFRRQGAEVESYRAVLDLTEHAAGPIAFARDHSPGSRPKRNRR